MKKLYNILAAVLLTISVFAQSPEKMSYQAVVRNDKGVLVQNSPIGLRISILQGSTTGTEIYKEIFNPNPLTNANGLVSIEIGGGIKVSRETFSAINWSNGPYFVKTETDPLGGTDYSITGVSQLLSVPYALYTTTADSAKNSNLLEGKPGSYYTSAPNLTGTINNSRFSAFQNLFDKGYFDNNSGSDILLRAQADTRYLERSIQTADPVITSYSLTTGSTTPVTINSISITVPAAGKIFVSFNGFLELSANGYLYVKGQIMTTAGIPSATSGGGIAARATVTTTWTTFPMSTSATFSVAAAGTYIFYYRAQHYTADSPTCTFHSGNMTAIYTQD